ncbi:glycine/sarcosine/betaine reductase component B subunit [Candidatus Entotheonella palauensis]|nr:glycine/sarcosine/betaine reductase component B subunit [Candidatus Entotheonella palauensis]
MQLKLAYHAISDMQFNSNSATRLDGTTLHIDQAALHQYLLEDRRLAGIETHIVHPGESCRFGIVFDILEPRAKEPGAGPDFPGILGSMEAAGQGMTHVLQGTAVTVLDSEAPVAGGKVVEMSGEAGETCPYSPLHHLVVIPRAAPDVERHAGLNALRLASVKASVFLARAAVGQAVAAKAIEVFELSGLTNPDREGLPRIAYIGQIHSRQRVAEVDEQILYGANTIGMVPVLLHPNEWMDGALVTSYMTRGVETYFYQNHPIITELYRWHREGKMTFAGAIATMAGSDNDDRPRNAMLASQQAKWVLAADGVVLTKYGGGAPHADMALTAKMCEDL